MFTDSSPGAPEAAFVKQNDPLDDPAIPTLVAAGYVVRTRADADTVEARSGDTGPRDAAIASGAQWVSTDYPVANPSSAPATSSRFPAACRRAAIRSTPRRAAGPSGWNACPKT